MNKRYRGSLYEDMAAEYLLNKGFEILERNYRCRIGEIDIIAKKDNILRFIEVKYRKNLEFGYSIQAVSTNKQQKIIKAAQWYMYEKNISDNVECSFDIIGIQGNNIQYIFNGYGAM
jgi:putative endonuclease